MSIIILLNQSSFEQALRWVLRAVLGGLVILVLHRTCSALVVEGNLHHYDGVAVRGTPVELADGFQVFTIVLVQVELQVTPRRRLSEVAVVRKLHVGHVACFAVGQIYWGALAHQVSVSAKRNYGLNDTFLTSGCLLSLNQLRAPQHIRRELATLGFWTKHEPVICVLIYVCDWFQMLGTSSDMAQRSIVGLRFIRFIVLLHFNLLVMLFIYDIDITFENFGLVALLGWFSIL